MPTDFTKISIQHWIHAITTMARLHGWYVTEHDARHHGPTHICLKDSYVLVLFARPSGGKLLEQHKRPFDEWTEAALANSYVAVMIARPEDAEKLWAQITDEGE